jgi:hypothetical protein
MISLTLERLFTRISRLYSDTASVNSSCNSAASLDLVPRILLISPGFHGHITGVRKTTTKKHPRTTQKFYLRTSQASDLMVASLKSACHFKFEPIIFVLIPIYRQAQRLNGKDSTSRRCTRVYLKFDFQNFNWGDFTYGEGGINLILVGLSSSKGG